MLVINDNSRVQLMHEAYEYDIKTRNFDFLTQLHSCNARVFEDDDAYYLESYETIIAMIMKSSKNCYDFLRLVYGYTATSAQHISKFCKDYNATTIYRYK